MFYLSTSGQVGCRFRRFKFPVAAGAALVTLVQELKYSNPMFTPDRWDISGDSTSRYRNTPILLQQSPPRFNHFNIKGRHSDIVPVCAIVEKSIGLHGLATLKLLYLYLGQAPVPCNSGSYMLRKCPLFQQQHQRTVSARTIAPKHKSLRPQFPRRYPIRMCTYCHRRPN